MKSLLCLWTIFALVAFAPTAEAAKRKLTVDSETAEGALLKQIVDEADAAKKIALLEEFTSKHAAHESATWAFGELQTAYLAGGQFEKAYAAGEKVLAADPDDVPVASNNLKAAEGLKDAGRIRKSAVHLSGAARRAAAAPKPADEDEVNTWQGAVTYAKQVDAYADYSIYTLAAGAADPAQRIELAEWLATNSPGSQYNAPLRPMLFVAYQQTGNHAKALAIAEAELAGPSPDNDDMLVYAASRAYEAKDHAKAAGYATKLVETLPAKPAPRGMDEAAWTKNRNLKLGVGHWMLGLIASSGQRWADADKSLRAALPLVQENKDMAAETLFHLGLANFRLGDGAKGDKKRIVDALKFNQQCATLASPYQAQARKNVAAIRSQYRIQ